MRTEAQPFRAIHRLFDSSLRRCTDTPTALTDLLLEDSDRAFFCLLVDALTMLPEQRSVCKVRSFSSSTSSKVHHTIDNCKMPFWKKLRVMRFWRRKKKPMDSCEPATIMPSVQQPGEGEAKLDDSKHSGVQQRSPPDASDFLASSMLCSSPPATTTLESGRISPRSMADLMSTDSSSRSTSPSAEWIHRGLDDDFLPAELYSSLSALDSPRLITTGTRQPSPEISESSDESLLDELEASFQKYGSQEHWDLIISTSTTDFRVHKSVLCSASPFFRAACNGDFKEAHTGIIHLPESADVVHLMLGYIYWGCFEGSPQDIDQLIELHLAADKVSS